MQLSCVKAGGSQGKHCDSDVFSEDFAVLSLLRVQLWLKKPNENISGWNVPAVATEITVPRSIPWAEFQNWNSISSVNGRKNERSTNCERNKTV